MDGIVGPNTLKALNAREPKSLFNEIKAERFAFIDRIVKSRPANGRYERGWKNRINDINYEG